MKWIANASLLLIIFFATTASAADVKMTGAYLGGAYGVTEMDDDDAYSRGFDDEDEAIQLWGGYRFLSWFAVEGRLASLGQYDDIISNGQGQVEADTLTVHAVFIAPFGGSGWDLYGHLGLGVVFYEEKAGSFKNDDEGSVASAGLGVRWTPISQMTLSVGVDAYAWELESVFEDYDISVGITRLGIQYNF